MTPSTRSSSRGVRRLSGGSLSEIWSLASIRDLFEVGSTDKSSHSLLPRLAQGMSGSAERPFYWNLSTVAPCQVPPGLSPDRRDECRRWIGSKTLPSAIEGAHAFGRDIVERRTGPSDAPQVHSGEDLGEAHRAGAHAGRRPGRTSPAQHRGQAAAVRPELPHAVRGTGADPMDRRQRPLPLLLL